MRRRENHSISLVTVIILLNGVLSDLHSDIFQLTKNRTIYKYVPRYHVLFQFQWMKECMNRFSSTERSITTVGHNLTWWSSLSIKLSPISIPPYSAAVYMNSVESMKENNWVLLESEGISLTVTLWIFQVTVLTSHGNKSSLITVRLLLLKRSDWWTTRCISNNVDSTDVFRAMGAATAGWPSCSFFLNVYLHIIWETVDLFSYLRGANVFATVKFIVRGFYFLDFMDLQSIESSQ